MNARSNLRLLVLGVLVASLLGTLIARLFYLQVMESAEYRSAAQSNTVREIVNPAVRGLILAPVVVPGIGKIVRTLTPEVAVL